MFGDEIPSTNVNAVRSPERGYVMVSTAKHPRLIASVASMEEAMLAIRSTFSEVGGQYGCPPIEATPTEVGGWTLSWEAGVWEFDGARHTTADTLLDYYRYGLERRGIYPTKELGGDKPWLVNRARFPWNADEPVIGKAMTWSVELVPTDALWKLNFRNEFYSSEAQS